MAILGLSILSVIFLITLVWRRKRLVEKFKANPILFAAELGMVICSLIYLWQEFLKREGE